MGLAALGKIIIILNLYWFLQYGVKGTHREAVVNFCRGVRPFLKYGKGVADLLKHNQGVGWIDSIHPI